MPKMLTRPKINWVAAAENKDSEKALLNFDYCRFYMFVDEPEPDYFIASVTGPATEVKSSVLTSLEDCKIWCELIVDQQLAYLQSNKVTKVDL